MTYRNELPVESTRTSQIHRTMVRTLLVVLLLTAVSMAAELPDAPSAVVPGNAALITVTVPIQGRKIAPARAEIKPIDMKFMSLTIISTGSTFADSYTTLFARENWLAGKKGVCNVEVQSAYLYGTHPTIGRAYAVASVKSLTSVAAAYYLRKHRSRFWSAPLLTNSIISLEGVSQNMATCN
jgi:hypothetical protein